MDTYIDRHIESCKVTHVHVIAADSFRSIGAVLSGRIADKLVRQTSFNIDVTGFSGAFLE